LVVDVVYIKKEKFFVVSCMDGAITGRGKSLISAMKSFLKNLKDEYYRLSKDLDNLSKVDKLKYLKLEIEGVKNWK